MGCNFYLTISNINNPCQINMTIHNQRVRVITAILTAKTTMMANDCLNQKISLLQLQKMNSVKAWRIRWNYFYRSWFKIQLNKINR